MTGIKRQEQEELEVYLNKGKIPKLKD